MDPMQRDPDAGHPIAWYYGKLLMGYITRAALAERVARYAENRKRLRGCPESPASSFTEWPQEAVR